MSITKKPRAATSYRAARRNAARALAKLQPVKGGQSRQVRRAAGRFAAMRSVSLAATGRA